MDNMQTMDLDYKPWGGLAGVYHGMQAADIDARNAQRLQQGDLENIIKAKEAALAQDEMNNPEYRDWRLKGLMGKDQSMAASGQFDQRVLQDKIKEVQADLMNKRSKAELETLLSKFNNGISTMEINGPAGFAAVLEQVDPKMRQILQQWGPEGTLQWAKQQVNMINEHLSKTPSFYAEKAKQAQKAESDLAVAREHSRGSAQATGIRAGTDLKINQMNIEAGKYKDKNALSIASSLAKAGNYERASAVYYDLALNATDEASRDRYMNASIEMEAKATALKTAPVTTKGEQERETLRDLRNPAPSKSGVTSGGVKYQRIE